MRCKCSTFKTNVCTLHIAQTFSECKKRARALRTPAECNTPLSRLRGALPFYPEATSTISAPQHRRHRHRRRLCGFLLVMASGKTITAYRKTRNTRWPPLGKARGGCRTPVVVTRGYAAVSAELANSAAAPAATEAATTITTTAAAVATRALNATRWDTYLPPEMRSRARPRRPLARIYLRIHNAESTMRRHDHHYYYALGGWGLLGGVGILMCAKSRTKRMCGYLERGIKRKNQNQIQCALPHSFQI